MRKATAGILSAGALFMAAAASPATAAPNERACAHDKPHGTQRAHMTVPHRNEQAHRSIPHFCDDH